MLLNFTPVIQQNCHQPGWKFEKSFCAVDRLSCQLELPKSETSQFGSDLVFDIVNHVHLICLHVQTSVLLKFHGPLMCRNRPDVGNIIPIKPRSHCADHSLPMFPIIADRPDLSWSWQNHQIVALAPNLCLSKTASRILVRQLYETGTTEVFDPLLVRFPRPLVRPLIRSTRLRTRCWRPHPCSCRFATTIKMT